MKKNKSLENGMLKHTNVYFHIDEVSRDAVTASALKLKLSEAGINLVYGNRTITSTLLNRNSNAFDLIILPRPFFLPENFPQKVPVVVLFTECVGRMYTNDQFALVSIFDREFIEGNRKNFDRVSLFLIWGTKGLDLVKKYYPQYIDKFSVVGAPRLDPLCQGKRDLVIKNNTKIKIGFITRQPILNDYSNRSGLDFIFNETLLFENQYSYWLSDSDNLIWQEDPIYDRFYKQSLDVVTTLKIIQHLSLDTHELHIRAHPTENFYNWERLISKFKLKVTLGSHLEPFSHWIKGMDYLIGPPSTSFYDAIPNGIQPISTRYINPNRENHLHPFSEEHGELQQFITSPKSLEQLLQIVTKKPDSNYENKDALQVILKESGYSKGDEPIKKISLLIINELKKYNAPKKRTGSRYGLAKFYCQVWVINLVLKIKYRFSKQSPISSNFILDSKMRNLIDNLARV